MNTTNYIVCCKTIEGYRIQSVCIENEIPQIVKEIRQQSEVEKPMILAVPIQNLNMTVGNILSGNGIQDISKKAESLAVKAIESFNKGHIMKGVKVLTDLKI